MADSITSSFRRNAAAAGARISSAAGYLNQKFKNANRLADTYADPTTNYSLSKRIAGGLWAEARGTFLQNTGIFGTYAQNRLEGARVPLASMLSRHAIMSATSQMGIVGSAVTAALTSIPDIEERKAKVTTGNVTQENLVNAIKGIDEKFVDEINTLRKQTRNMRDGVVKKFKPVIERIDKVETKFEGFEIFRRTMNRRIQVVEDNARVIGNKKFGGGDGGANDNDDDPGGGGGGSGPNRGGGGAAPKPANDNSGGWVSNLIGNTMGGVAGGVAAGYLSKGWMGRAAGMVGRGVVRGAAAIGGAALAPEIGTAATVLGGGYMAYQFLKDYIGPAQAQQQTKRPIQPDQPLIPYAGRGGSAQPPPDPVPQMASPKTTPSKANSQTIKVPEISVIDFLLNAKQDVKISALTGEINLKAKTIRLSAQKLIFDVNAFESAKKLLKSEDGEVKLQKASYGGAEAEESAMPSATAGRPEPTAEQEGWVGGSGGTRGDTSYGKQGYSGSPSGTVGSSPSISNKSQRAKPWFGVEPNSSSSTNVGASSRGSYQGGPAVEAPTENNSANPVSKPGAAQKSAGDMSGVFGRDRWADELQNPNVKDKMLALALSEVGDKSPEAQRALMETIFNRADAQKKKSLNSTMGADYYEPMQNGSYHRNLARIKANPELRARLEERFNEVMAGSNDSNFSTHNGSAGVAASAKRTQSIGNEIAGETFSRKDNPDYANLHGAGTVKNESEWFNNMSQRMTEAENKGPSGFGFYPKTKKMLSGLLGGQQASDRYQGLKGVSLYSGDYDTKDAKANFMKPDEFGPPGSNLTDIETAGGHKFRIHEASSEAFKGFVEELEKQGMPLGTIGGYSPRPGGIGGSGRMSQHSMGNAMDIGSQTARDVINPKTRDWIEKNPDKWRSALNRYGMVDGGNFSNPDLGHVEWSGNKPWVAEQEEKQKQMMAKAKRDSDVAASLKASPEGQATQAPVIEEKMKAAEAPPAIPAPDLPPVPPPSPSTPATPEQQQRNQTKASDDSEKITAPIHDPEEKPPAPGSDGYGRKYNKDLPIST